MLLLGASVPEAEASALFAYGVARVHALEHALLNEYNPDVFTTTITEAVRRINDAMNSIIVAAMHPDGPDAADGRGGAPTPTADDLAVARIINQVWFSSLVGWVGGVDPADRVGEDLEVATRLLVRGG